MFLKKSYFRFINSPFIKQLNSICKISFFFLYKLFKKNKNYLKFESFLIVRGDFNKLLKI